MKLNSAKNWTLKTCARDTPTILCLATAFLQIFRKKRQKVRLGIVVRKERYSEENGEAPDK